MNIGIDVDGVLVDVESYQRTWGKRYFEEALHMPVKNPKGYDICDIYGCSRKEREKFWTKYIWAYCLTQPPMKDAPRIIAKLHKDGHRIVLITSRAHTTEAGITGRLFRWMLRYWLKKNRIFYDDIVFCSEKDSSAHKRQVCAEKKIHVMIDDKPENLLALADQIHVICYPAAWNEDVQCSAFIRVRGWRDIYDRIAGLNISGRTS